MTAQGTRAPPRSISGSRLDPREIAARVVERVQREGAFAAALLDLELRHGRSEIEDRDRGLATELVYGVLRTHGVLSGLLHEQAPRGVAGGDSLVLSHLQVALYQLLFLDRVPAYAAVDSAVGAITRARGRRVGGFANAVLRRLATGRRMPLDEAIEQSAPAWLRGRLESEVGREEMLALLGVVPPECVRDSGAPDGVASSLPTAALPRLPERPHSWRVGGTSLRLIEGRPEPEWLAEEPRGRWSPRARRLRSFGDPRRRAGYQEGVYTLQEEGAQLVTLAVGARPGERILDACAGRGLKTSLLREQIGEAAELWAMDKSEAKLRQLREEFSRLHLAPPRTAAVDWTSGNRPSTEGLDRVLVDAPCSGVGTLRRRPEISLRLQPEDPVRLGRLAQTILRAACLHARPGGRVVFAVCSVLPEESTDVLAGVQDLLEPVPFDAPELGLLVDPSASTLTLLPRRHETDGYFVASLRRR